MRNILLNHLPGDGSPAPEVNEQNPANSPAPSPDNSPAAPKTAATILKGEVTEEALKLQVELEETKRLLKLRETDVAEWQRETQRLKASIEQPQPVPVKREPEQRRLRIGRFVG